MDNQSIDLGRKGKRKGTGLEREESRMEWYGDDGPRCVGAFIKSITAMRKARRKEELGRWMFA